MAKRKKNKRGRKGFGQRQQPQNRNRQPKPSAPAVPVAQQPISPHQGNMNAAAQGSQGAGQPDPAQKRKERLERLQVLCNVILAGCGLVALVVGYVQLKAVFRQIDQTDAIIKQMKLDKRAWLYMDASLEPLPQEHVNCRLQIKNYGDGTATIKRALITAHILKSFDEDETAIKAHEKMPREGKDETGQIVLPPSVNVVATQDMGKLPKGTIKDAHVGESLFLLIVTEEYELFAGEGPRHRTRLAWMYDSNYLNLTRYDKFSVAD